METSCARELCLRVQGNHAEQGRKVYRFEQEITGRLPALPEDRREAELRLQGFLIIEDGFPSSLRARQAERTNARQRASGDLKLLGLELHQQGGQLMHLNIDIIADCIDHSDIFQP